MEKIFKRFLLYIGITDVFIIWSLCDKILYDWATEIRNPTWSVFHQPSGFWVDRIFLLKRIILTFGNLISSSTNLGDYICQYYIVDSSSFIDIQFWNVFFFCHCERIKSTKIKYELWVIIWVSLWVDLLLVPHCFIYYCSYQNFHLRIMSGNI